VLCGAGRRRTKTREQALRDFPPVGVNNRPRFKRAPGANCFAGGQIDACALYWYTSRAKVGTGTIRPRLCSCLRYNLFRDRLPWDFPVLYGPESGIPLVGHNFTFFPLAPPFDPSFRLLVARYCHVPIGRLPYDLRNVQFHRPIIKLTATLCFAPLFLTKTILQVLFPAA
jgi:hypothetical protein